MHGARQRVKFGIVFTRGFAEPAGRGREFIPEAIEIDALTASHQAFHVRAAESEVPKQRVLQNFFPWTDAGERRGGTPSSPHRGPGLTRHLAVCPCASVSKSDKSGAA